MKTIRNIAIVVGVSLALFALGPTRAGAQAFSSTHFAGTFTLPLETHWGAVTLPAGDYTLTYGTAFSSTYLVAVTDEAAGRTLGMILPGARGDVKAGKDVLDCVREGNILYVRALEMPLIGESIHFKIPHGVEVRSMVIAKHQSESGNTRIAEVRITVERAPIKLIGK